MILRTWLVALGTSFIAFFAWYMFLILMPGLNQVGNILTKTFAQTLARLQILESGGSGFAGYFDSGDPIFVYPAQVFMAALLVLVVEGAVPVAALACLGAVMGARCRAKTLRCLCCGCALRRLTVPRCPSCGEAI